jgi:hypothetical protein
MPFDHNELRQRVTAKRRALGLPEPATAQREERTSFQARFEAPAPVARKPERGVRRFYRAPLVGRFFRILAAIYNFPVILQNLERHYADTAARLTSADQGRAATQARLDRLEQSLASLAEARLERERFERRVALLSLKADLLGAVAGVDGNPNNLVEHVNDVDSELVRHMSGIKPEAVLAIEPDGLPSAGKARRALADAIVLRGGLENLSHRELDRVFAASAFLREGGLMLLQGLGRNLAGEPFDLTLISLLARRGGLELQRVVEGNEGSAFALVLNRSKRARSAA